MTTPAPWPGPTSRESESRHSPEYRRCCSTPDVRCTRWCAECDRTLESGCPAEALSTALRAMARRSVMLRATGRQLHAKYMELLADRDGLRDQDAPHEDCCPLRRDGDPDIRRYHTCEPVPATFCAHHGDDNYFDRTLCAPPCETFHTCCAECHKPLDPCAHSVDRSAHLVELVRHAEELASDFRDQPQLDPAEVSDWLHGSSDPGPRPVDNPEALAERIRGLKAAQILTRLVELQHGNAPPGWVDRWHDAWVEAHELIRKSADA